MATNHSKHNDIQILRALAIIFVLLVHLSFLTLVFRTTPIVVNNPFWCGVDLFFVISGLVVTQSIFRRPLNAGQFIIRRLFRLWPAIILFCAFSAIVIFIASLFPGSWAGSRVAISPIFFVRQVAAVLGGYLINDSAGLSYTFGAMWSLSVEFQFYAAYAIWLVALGFFAISKDKVRTATLSVAALLYLLCFARRVGFLYGADILGGTPIEYMQYYRFDMMLLGILVSLIPPIKAEWGKAAVPLLLVLPIILIAISEPVHGERPAQMLDGLSLVVAGLCFALVCAIANGGAAFHGKQTRLYSILLWVGDRSYSIYLLHFPAFALVWCMFFWIDPKLVSGWLGSVVQILTAIPLSLLLADLSFRFVEIPGQALGQKLMGRRSLTEMPIAP